MKKVKREKFLGLIVIFLIANIIVSVLRYSEYLVGRFTPASYLWTYNYITPEQNEYSVGDTIWFTAERYSRRPFKVTINDQIYCVLDNRSVFTKEYTVHLTYSSGTIMSRFPFGDYDDPYKLHIQADYCYLHSCQYVTYYGSQKSQCFISNSFKVK